jgi:hypothetical protein
MPRKSKRFSGAYLFLKKVVKRELFFFLLFFSVIFA